MADPHNVVLKVLTPTGTVTKTYVFEAVSDVEPTDSVELSKEPGVMGRIGPLFPRSLSFKVRVRDDDPRTPDYPTARAQHNLLRSLVGRLLFIDARSAPPETIYWTLENVKGMDSNEAKNAWDVDISAAEILGGEFGEFIDPGELGAETGLVPVNISSPDVLGVGRGIYNLQFSRALLLAHPPVTDAIGFAAQELYHLNPLANTFEVNQDHFNAIAQVSNSHAADDLVNKQKDSLHGNTNRLMVFGAQLPDMTGTEGRFQATINGLQLTFLVNATNQTDLIYILIGTDEPFSTTGRTIALRPGVAYYLKAVADEPSVEVGSTKREGILFPTKLDCIILFSPDRSGRKMAAGLSHFSILVAFTGGLLA